jgi:hypothetical protein
MVPCLGRPGDGDLAIGMKGAVAAGRRDDDRAVIDRAEDLGAHVDGADIDESSRAQREFPEALAVGAQSRFIVDAGGHVTEMRRRNVVLHDRLEVEDVQRLLGIADQLVEIARSPVGRIRWTQALRQGGLREQRACSQELQQTAAARRVKM